MNFSKTRTKSFVSIVTTKEVQTNKLAAKDKLNLAYMLVEEDPVNILKLARNTCGNR